MEWLLSGKLETGDGKQPSFTGCRIEASFDRKPAAAAAVRSTSGSARNELAGGTEAGTLREVGAATGLAAGAIGATASVAGPTAVRVSALSDAEGNFTLVLPDRAEIASERVKLQVFSAVGELIHETELESARADNSITITLSEFESTVLVKLDDAPLPATRRIRGRIIERTGKQLPPSLQVLLLGHEQGARGGNSSTPILVAKADSYGYFSGEVPTSKFDHVVAVVAGIPGEIRVRLVDSLIPSRVPIVVDLPRKPEGSPPKDCKCSALTVPRTPTQEEIADAPGVFSTDLGTGQCIRLNVPNRAIEEFSFYSVVRTTEPAIVGVTSGTVHDEPVTLPSTPPEPESDIPLLSSPSGVSATTIERIIRSDIESLRLNPFSSVNWFMVEGTIRAAVNKAGGTSLPSDFFNQFPGWGIGFVWGFGSGFLGFGSGSAKLDEVIGKAAAAGAGATPAAGAARSLALRMIETPTASTSARTPVRPLDIYELRGLKRPLGRVPLDKKVPVDWDDTPTFYEAASIAHGHLLHFKQIWFADGYSLGDLLYSLPLAPGQKKLISIVDWERREQTTREEFTSAGEGLQASLTRDRDLSEVVSGMLSESAQGGSHNTTAGAGFGTGAAGNGSYQQFNFGALVGVSGGVGVSDSSAFQASSRNLSSSSLQTLRDNTLQSASAVRNLRSTIIQTARQGEAVRATTEVVANHNHCHALTVEYFEVLRHLMVTNKLTDVQECLFVPFPMVEFTRPKVLRWRQSLSTYLQRRELAPAFDATRRVQTNWSEVDTPAARYADEMITAIFGELTLTILIPLPPFPAKPKPNPEETAEDAAAAVGKALAPTEGFLGVVLAIASGGASLATGAAIDATSNAVKATTQGARALAESLLDEPSAEERYARFQQEVMPAAAVGFVDQLELYALVGASEVKLSGADFTLVSNYQPGTPLLVSVRGRVSNSVRRAAISAIVIKSSAPLPQGCTAIVNSASLRYQTRLFRHDLVNDERVNDDIDLPAVAYTGTPSNPLSPAFPFPLPLPFPPGFPDWIPIPGMTPLRTGNGAILYTPLDEWEQRWPRREDVRLSAELIEHLNANLEYYHHAIWWTMDPNRRYMLLDGYQAPNAGGRSVASVVDNTLIGIIGNSLILPVAPGNYLDPTFKLLKGATLLEHYDPQSPAPPSRVSLPTRGVFAEAIMGDCNACEEIDDTRFWRWEESPIDEPPSLDGALVASRRSDPNYGTPTAFPTPIVSIQNAPQAPNPAGVQPVLDTLAKQSFADITGLAGTQANAAAAYAKAMDTALAFGKEASTLAQQAGMTKNIGQTMGAIDKAQTAGKIDESDAKQLRTAALKKMVGDDSAEDKASSEAETDQKKATTEVIRKIPGDAVESVETTDSSGTSTTVKANTSPASSPKAGAGVERTLRFFSTYPKTNVAVFGTYDFGIDNVVTRGRDGNSFSLRPGATVGYIRTTLPSGAWTLTGRVMVDLPASTWSVPVTVGPGLNPFNFAVSAEVAASVVPFNLGGPVSVKPAMRVIDIYMEPTFEQTTVEREIDLSLGATTAAKATAEVKAGVEAETNALIEKAKVNGEIAFSGELSVSGTANAGQKVKLTITHKKLTGFTLVQK